VKKTQIGKDGLEFTQQKNGIVTAGICYDTRSQLQLTKPIVDAELSVIRKRVLVAENDGEEMNGKKLKELFAHSPLAAGAEDRDWQRWADNFKRGDKKPGDRWTAKDARNAFLSDKTGLTAGTIEVYLSKDKKHKS